MLSDTGHTGVLDVSAVGFSPAWKLALVNAELCTNAGDVVHPDQTGSCK